MMHDAMFGNGGEEGGFANLEETRKLLLLPQFLMIMEK